MHKVLKVLLRFSFNLIYWNPFRPIKFWGVTVIFEPTHQSLCFFSLEFVDGCSRGRADARKKQWSTGNFHLIFWFITSSLVFLFTFTFLWRRFKRLVARGDVNSRCFSERCSNWTLNLRWKEVAENMCKIIKIILCMCSATSFHSCRYFVCCINPLRCTKWQAAAGGYPLLRALQCGELIISESQEL